MTQEQKNWIDAASYEDLLRRWRFSPSGDPMFQGETGKYFAAVMMHKRTEHPDPSKVSRKVGWSAAGPLRDAGE